ncbi:DsrE family protein [Rubinisphaera italica]|uniref:DsrE/DsrF-like family protein n=1 Tax=Rubinisphaera italica TaxID=2527969 RepID=A0A5C5XH01_9PLAN|nr:DsrE family protein [Rubinisphaera italica]TWT61691.1 DsrE/DsrF-like family protein [Rubinisphaera italica]
MKYQATVFALIAIGGAIGFGVASGQTSPLTDESTHPDESQYVNPAIKDYGKVVQLPNAAHQPRDGSRIVVDITKGGDSDKLNPAIEKVCRFVNIYAGAGKESAKVDIAVVLHGDATLAILRNDAYSTRFSSKANPNLKCLSELQKAGVKVYVCGQSLIGKGAKPSEVTEQVDVAVSALTALVNLQADGYAYLPMLK